MCGCCRIRRCDIIRGVDESRAGKCPDVDPGADVFLEGASQWSCRNTAIIQYEDERIDLQIRAAIPEGANAEVRNLKVELR